MKRRHLGWMGLLAATTALLAAPGCGSSSGTGGAGTGGSTGTGAAAPGSLIFSISGEVLALGGYAFPPTSKSDPVFVDGWEVKFTELLVTVDKIKLWESPDTDPGDQSKVGAQVAEVDGPWVVDLHKGGPLPGKGGTGEQAVQLATLADQNLKGHQAFATDSRYAFGFDAITATSAAKNVNLDAQGMADYAMMQQKGYVVLYVGTATFKGTSCTPATADTNLPPVVSFKLGFKSPTSYINCQNPDNDPAKPLGMEEHERGIFIKGNQPVVAQLTFHTDHPFWESFVHDSPAHFDMIAAQYTGSTATPTAVLEDLEGLDPTAITDKQMKPVLWRTCSPFYTPPHTGQLSFDPLGIQVNPSGDPSKTIHDLYDYMTYNQSTQGHLNSNGLCFVERHYPSPQ